MARSIVLLSGGLDSTVNLARAVAETEVHTVLYFDFGHKAAQRELRAARNIVAKFGNVKLRTISLSWLETITASAMVDSKKRIPQVPGFEALDVPENGNDVSEYARMVWVPNRLGLFVNIGACFAEAEDCDYIVMGLNNTRGVTSPDHTASFFQAANEALQNSTLTAPQVVSYTGAMSKAEIVGHGHEIGAPLESIWDCYGGDAKMCGRCESCMRLIQAMEQSQQAEWWWNLRTMRPHDTSPA